MNVCPKEMIEQACAKPKTGRYSHEPDVFSFLALAYLFLTETFHRVIFLQLPEGFPPPPPNRRHASRGSIMPCNLH